MHFGELADILTANAKTYRNGKLLKEIAPQLAGKPINERSVRAVLEPFVQQVMPLLPAEVKRMIERRLEEAVPNAMTSMRINAHMHQADNTGIMSQNNADAILVDFVNAACIPLDLAFYAVDLLETSKTEE